MTKLVLKYTAYCGAEIMHHRGLGEFWGMSYLEYCYIVFSKGYDFIEEFTALTDYKTSIKISDIRYPMCSGFGRVHVFFEMDFGSKREFNKYKLQNPDGFEQLQSRMMVNNDYLKDTVPVYCNYHIKEDTEINYVAL